jgi:hypothetical protein
MAEYREGAAARGRARGDAGTSYRRLASPCNRRGKRGGPDAHRDRCGRAPGMTLHSASSQTPRCAHASTCVTSGDTGWRGTRTPRARRRHASTRVGRARRSAALWIV